MQADEDGVRDEGVGEGPATLQAEMMPPGQKIVFYHCQKRRDLWSFGVRLLVVFSCVIVVDRCIVFSLLFGARQK